MTERFPDHSPLALPQLAREIGALALPGYSGLTRLSREQGESGRWVPSAPYLLVKCDPLTAEQIVSVQAAINAHVPAAVLLSPDPDNELSAAIIAVDTSSIADANTKKAIDDLKSALLGSKSQGRVKGRLV